VKGQVNGEDAQKVGASRIFQWREFPGGGSKSFKQGPSQRVWETEANNSVRSMGGVEPPPLTPSWYASGTEQVGSARPKSYSTVVDESVPLLDKVC